MTVLLRNNAETVLATALSSADLGMTVVSGGRFPEPAAGEYFYATITALTGLFEIVKVTARNGNTMTIVRGREGTAALDFIAGSRVELRITAQAITDAIVDSEFDSDAYFVADGTGVSVGLNVGASKTLSAAGTINAASGTLILPQNTVTAQTAEGAVVWDTNDDLLTVGTGTGRKTMVDTVATQTLSGKTFTSPTINGGTINNAPIGASTPASGAFTTLSANGAVSFLPLGVIVLWYGDINNPPQGWRVCDGNFNTPDLRNRFVVGAGDTYAVNTTGGSKDAVVVSHNHTAVSTVTEPNEGRGHGHQFIFANGTQTSPNQTQTGGFMVNQATNVPVGPNTANATVTNQIGANTTGITVGTVVNTNGVDGEDANLPPYYALAYIMRSI